METTLLDHLRSVGAEALYREGMESHVHIRTFQRGAYACRSGEEVKELLLVVKGMLLVVAGTEGGRAGTVAEVSPPQFLGDIEFIDGTAYLHTVIAETEVTAIGFPLRFVNSMYADDASFFKFMARISLNKLYLTSDEYSKVLLYPVKARIALYLQDNEKEDGTTEVIGTRIAAQFGTTTRHVSRVLSSFQAKGLIEKAAPRQFRIIDREGLKGECLV